MLTKPDYLEKITVFIPAQSHEFRFQNENLAVYEKDSSKLWHQLSCHKIFCVFICGNASITTVLLEKAATYGFTIIFMKSNFRVIAAFGQQAEGNTILRKAQYANSNMLPIARRIVADKIAGQLANLIAIREKSDRTREAIGKLRENLDKLNAVAPADLSHLLGVEGNSSKIYFSAYFEDQDWRGRQPRVKRDELNCLLDIGYTFLFNFVEAHCRLFGFDPFVGVLHREFYQRKSLVCDLVEPFRPEIDRAARNGFHLGQFKKRDFIQSKGQYALRIDKNKKYTAALFERLVAIRGDIFDYVRAFYRAMARGAEADKFPTRNGVGEPC